MLPTGCGCHCTRERASGIFVAVASVAGAFVIAGILSGWFFTW